MDEPLHILKKLNIEKQKSRGVFVDVKRQLMNAVCTTYVWDVVATFWLKLV